SQRGPSYNELPTSTGACHNAAREPSRGGVVPSSQYGHQQQQQADFDSSEDCKAFVAALNKAEQAAAELLAELGLDIYQRQSGQENQEEERRQKEEEMSTEDSCLQFWALVFMNIRMLVLKQVKPKEKGKSYDVEPDVVELTNRKDPPETIDLTT
ncbi:hypothetical protein THAOC_23063, partial [Thalassiosira oceanica]